MLKLLYPLSLLSIKGSTQKVGRSREGWLLVGKYTTENRKSSRESRREVGWKEEKLSNYKTRKEMKPDHHQHHIHTKKLLHCFRREEYSTTKQVRQHRNWEIQTHKLFKIRTWPTSKIMMRKRERKNGMNSHEGVHFEDVLKVRVKEGRRSWWWWWWCECNCCPFSI